MRRPTPGSSALLDIPDNYPKLVVSMDPVIGADYKGVRHLHIREFLLTEW